LTGVLLLSGQLNIDFGSSCRFFNSGISQKSHVLKKEHGKESCLRISFLSLFILGGSRTSPGKIPCFSVSTVLLYAEKVDNASRTIGTAVPKIKVSQNF